MNNVQKRYLLFTYLFIGLFLFFGSYQDRVVRATFLGRTVFLPLTYSVREYHTLNQLRNENHNQQMMIGGLLLKNINQETMLNTIRQSMIEFTTYDSTYILADIVGFSGDFLGRTIVINKGLLHGVQMDNPVFSTRGIVGKVMVPYQNFSIVLPINHSNFMLAVLNRNTGVQGILVSDLYSNVAMTFLRFGSNIAVGDTIVTSNLSQIFPANYPVGRVIRLEESSDAIYFRAVIEPFSDISNLQNVFILLRDRDEISEVDIETGY
ncbi:MAG: rod shape-determining protein MreC [Candidatus Cloacimonetes bacterium]|nr:rod shape-determining protein MreC [Candidatus Cloacimonadota bacterium]